MTFTNSPLVQYTKISPHKEPRNHAIDTITIHCVVGQILVESLGEIFQTKAASSNYGIGKDGRIAMYVEEKDRSYCSSSASNDHRAITIECASDMTEPFAINDKVWASLIKLLVDICKRNSIKELKWKADKSLIGQVDKQNMTVHRWFHSGKSCPGTYLYERMGQIAEEVNEKLGAANVEEEKKLYRVQIGAFKSKASAEDYLKKAVEDGFDGFIVYNGDLYRVQIGAFSAKNNAENYLKQAKSKGFEGFVVESDIQPEKVKNVAEIAQEVITGLWGNGDDRRRRLTEMGYDYTAVQAEVKKLINK